jgi:hypothetical protein
MTIAFIHSHKSFLPGLGAYLRFFGARGITTKICYPQQAGASQADVEWHFMGAQLSRNPRVLTVHEYASASTPPLRQLKDQLKKRINCRPDYRIFDSEYARDQFGFSDRVPCGIRKSGVLAGSVLSPIDPVEKNVDFIYVGTVARERQLKALFTPFKTGRLQNKSLLVLSRNYGYWQSKCRGCANIYFQGPVAWDQVYKYISQARYAINFVPNTPPFNHQPSSKLLDYAACGVPVVTTDYPWIRQFQAGFGGRFFYLAPDMGNLGWDAVTGFDFAFPDLTTWTWENQISSSGILDFLRSRGFTM